MYCTKCHKLSADRVSNTCDTCGAVLVNMPQSSPAAQVNAQPTAAARPQSAGFRSSSPQLAVPVQPALPVQTQPIVAVQTPQPITLQPASVPQTQPVQMAVSQQPAALPVAGPVLVPATAAMVNCTQCGQPRDAAATFCTNCGLQSAAQQPVTQTAPVGQLTPPVVVANQNPVSAAPQNVLPTASIVPKTSKSKGLMGALIGAGTAVVLAGAGVGLYFGLRPSDPVEPPPPPPVTVTMNGDSIVIADTDRDWQDISEDVRDSVVSIYLPATFFDESEQTWKEGSNSGTGFIFDEAGHIMTNAHVVSNTDKMVLDTDSILINFRDGTVFSAYIIGIDTEIDIAVLALDNPPQSLNPVPLGNSDEVRQGDEVMAYGNPKSLEDSATFGRVSNTSRNIGDGINYIQTDAAINHGNSGGPLFNRSGQVIGVNTARFDGADNLGFAIPINLANSVASGLVGQGVASLGVDVESSAVNVGVGAGRYGASVVAIQPAGPAAQAGLEIDDLIVGIDTNTVQSASDFYAAIQGRNVGDSVQITYLRDGVEKQTTATLAIGRQPSQNTATVEEPAQAAPQEEAPQEEAVPQDEPIEITESIFDFTGHGSELLGEYAERLQLYIEELDDDGNVLLVVIFDNQISSEDIDMFVQNNPTYRVLFIVDPDSQQYALFAGSQPKSHNTISFTDAQLEAILPSISNAVTNNPSDHPWAWAIDAVIDGLWDIVG